MKSRKRIIAKIIGNSIAKDIETFIKRVNSNHGFYIARYEAGVENYDSNAITTSNSNNETNWTGYVSESGKNLELVSKKDKQVWNYITQNKASELAKNMYSGRDYESDLVNGYAWDTAILFIQKCGTNSKYSRENGQSTTGEIVNTGTGTLARTNEIDKQCNIYDMSGNVCEWSTETYLNNEYPCVIRGGAASLSSSLTYTRGVNYSNIHAYEGVSFRSIIYF